MVVAGGELAGHVVEEAEYAGVLVIDGEEVVVHGVARAAAVEHPLPSVARGDVVAEAVGQVGQHVAIVPGHVHQRVARAALGVGRVLACAVIDVDGLLLAPGCGSEVHVVDVIVICRSTTVESIVPFLDHDRNRIICLGKNDGLVAVCRHYHPVCIDNSERVIIVGIFIIGFAEVHVNTAIRSSRIGEFCYTLTADHIDGIAVFVVKKERYAVASTVLIQLKSLSYPGVIRTAEIFRQCAADIRKGPPQSAQLLCQRVRLKFFRFVTRGKTQDKREQHHNDLYKSFHLKKNND